MSVLAERLRGALAEAHAREIMLLESDWRGEREPHARTLAEAAVLVPVVDRPEPTLLLTLRTETLRRHAGQIAFPGGRLDAEDASATAAALREAEEEIGLPPARVDVVGATDRYRTGSGFHITPVVGVVPPNLPLAPHEAEVAAVFEVPLAFALDPANQREGTGIFQGAERRFYEISWGERRIWGVTAALIVNLGRRLRGLL